MLEDTTTIYSIGHSNQSIESFLELLEKTGISCLVDVRSQPYSKYSPQFNSHELHAAVESTGREYLFAGDTLGGRPHGGEFYDDRGHVRYFRVAEAEFFQDGIARLKFLLSDRENVALLCSEEDPTNCHRRLLIGRVLRDEGILMQHIRSRGIIQPESSLGNADKVSSFLQQGLFDDNQESSWISSRSVLQARGQRTSLNH